jgi:hypothetical protein
MAQDKMRLNMTSQVLSKRLPRLFNWLISLVGTLLVVTSCNAPNENNTYHSDTLMLGFDYPTNWSVEEFNDHLDVRNPNGYGLQIFTEKSAYINQAENSEQLLESFLSEVEFPEILSEEPINNVTINDYDTASKRIILEIERGLPEELQGFPTSIPAQLQVDVIAIKDGDTRAIILGYQPPNLEELNFQLEMIIRSLQFW